ncbi:MAG: NYN domain-containing protein [Rhodospirillales bacterium]|nr:NYN domain-containing protein [Rhodospirillales bacterium]
MPIKGKEPSLAVLIDADNASARHARAIFEEIAKLGEANVRRIYGDFAGDRLKGWRGVIQPLAIVPQQQFNYTTGKNAADITLVIDAMDLMHRGGLDGFCLVSSDSDFTRLALRLRESGAVVFGFGAKKTPEPFRNACSRFIYVENLLEPTEGETKKAGAPAAAKKEPVTKAIPLIRKAMEQAWDSEDWVDLAVVGHRLNHLAPDFDPRTYGCEKLLTVVEKTKKFSIERPAGGRVRIKRR